MLHSTVQGMLPEAFFLEISLSITRQIALCYIVYIRYIIRPDRFDLISQRLVFGPQKCGSIFQPIKSRAIAPARVLPPLFLPTPDWLPLRLACVLMLSLFDSH